MVWFISGFTSPSKILKLYMWRHRCASGLKKKVDLRSDSQRNGHFVGLFKVPAQYKVYTSFLSFNVRVSCTMVCARTSAENNRHHCQMQVSDLTVIYIMCRKGPRKSNFHLPLLWTFVTASYLILENVQQLKRFPNLQQKRCPRIIPK